MAQLVKNLPAVQETWVLSLGLEDPLKKGKATHSHIWPGEFHRLYSPLGCKESDTIEQLSLMTHLIHIIILRISTIIIFIFQVSKWRKKHNLLKSHFFGFSFSYGKHLVLVRIIHLPRSHNCLMTKQKFKYKLSGSRVYAFNHKWRQEPPRCWSFPSQPHPTEDLLRCVPGILALTFPWVLVSGALKTQPLLLECGFRGFVVVIVWLWGYWNKSVWRHMMLSAGKEEDLRACWAHGHPSAPPLCYKLRIAFYKISAAEALSWALDYNKQKIHVCS